MKTFKNFLGEVKKPTGKLKDACWTGYTAVGMKMKGGRKVPNCVPEENEHLDEMDKSQPSSGRGAEGLPVGKKAYPVKTDKVKKDALKTLEKSYKKVKVHEAKDEEYADPHMAVNQLKTIMHNAEELMDMLGDKTDLPEWVESKITLAEDYIMTVANYMRSEMHEEVEYIDEKSPAWQRKEGKSASGGLNRKGIASYRRENPGSKLSMAVTTKPSKLKPGSKAANRRKSFCARMSGMKKRLTSAKTARDPNSRINKSLRKWNC